MKCFNCIVVLTLIFIVGCETQPPRVFSIPDNANRLISGESMKTWKIAKRYNNNTRMNMGYCFLLHRDTYWSDGSFQNNSEENPDCGESLLAQWSIVQDSIGNSYIKLKGAKIPDLMGIDKDYKFFKILNLTEETMVLEYKHRQFSDQWRTIKDYWVRGDIDIEGRDFHW